MVPDVISVFFLTSLAFICPYGIDKFALTDFCL